MTVTTSYPGIYLSEEASLNFSITNTATAVPAFVYLPYADVKTPEEIIVRYNNLAEFFADVGSTPPASENHGLWYRAVQLWFECGGGYCYAVNYAFIIKIKEYDDITLLVAAVAGDSELASLIYEGFNNLIQQGSHIFGLFDGPEKKIEVSDIPNKIMDAYPNTSQAAVFYPPVSVSWSAFYVPASAAAAIAIAKTDRTRGVWKAPANVVINGITPLYPVSDDLQGRFNQGKALNMIRSFPDVGTVLWGARTLEDSDNWRYIPVRRLFSMVERDIQKALNKLVFEANSQPTWQRVKAAVNNYLYSLWQQGALPGNKEEEAWFVQIGKDITMTDDDINQGKMIVKIGLAAVRPAEFILLRFSQNIAQ